MTGRPVVQILVLKPLQFLSVLCPGVRMRVVIAQMKHETNTCSPVPTPLSRFATGGGVPLEQMQRPGRPVRPSRQI